MNNHQHQYIPVRDLYKSYCQAVETQLLNLSALFVIFIIFQSYWWFLSKPYLTQLLHPISQSKTRIYSCPMIVNNIQSIACHKWSSKHQYSRKSNPWVLCQKSHGVSTMKFKSWTFLVMVQAPHWLFLITYLHLRAWDTGGGLLNATKSWNPTRINIARPILECLKENCFLPYFSITCISKGKYVMVKKILRLLQYL